MTRVFTGPSAGMFLALGGGITLSINDLAIKALSGTYALHQIILIRALVGMALVLLIIHFSRTGFRQLRTRRRGAHLLRVSIVMVSNVTLMSAVVLGEHVGPRRWAAVAVGMAGVIVMTRPGEGVIQPAAILVLISAFCYASSHMMTRRMRDTESAMTLNFYVQCGFIVVSCAMGLAFGDGRFAQAPGSTWEFLFRPWVMPPVGDWWAFLASGLAVGLGGLMMSQAYRTTEAALVAPFEYVGMPMAILWGLVFFHSWPDMTAWAGIALICGAGLYTLWRETVRRKVEDVAAPSGDL